MSGNPVLSGNPVHSGNPVLLGNPVLASVVALLAAPLLIFNALFLTPALAALLTVAGLAGVALLIRALPRAPAANRGTLALCIGLGLALVVLGGEGRFFFAPDDWIIRDAVMADLVREPWPLAYERGGAVMWLRAPLGLYLVPALTGKVAGLAAAWAVMIVQNGVLFGLILFCFIRDLAGRDRFVALGVFLLFSGCDLVGFAIDYVKQPPGYAFNNIEMRYGRLAYVSHISQMFWAPHHSIAGWSIVAGYLAWRSQQLGAAGLAALFSLTLMWSPLAGLGGLPFVAVAGWRDLVGGRLRASSLAAPALCALAALPGAVYMVSGSGEVEKGWTFFDPEFMSHYLTLIGLEVLPFLLLVAIAPQALRDAKGRIDGVKATEFGLIGALLLLLPLYWVHFTNDLLLRASIPALALLALWVARIVSADLRHGFGPRRWIVAVLAIGMATPAFEIGRSLILPATLASSCNLLDAWDTGPWRKWPLTAYLADRAAFDAQGVWREPAAVVKAAGRICPWEKPGT